MGEGAVGLVDRSLPGGLRADDHPRIVVGDGDALSRCGLASLIELEDQRRVALAAETALVNLQRERVAAWIALYRALGGGWERPDAERTARTD